MALWLTFLTLKKLLKMNWSKQAWQSIKPIYAAITTMPFIQELANGSLDINKFRFYMKQDALYLEHFGKTLATIGAKTDSINDALAYIAFAENTIVVERALHETYFKDFDVTDKGTIEPACHHYIHFLKSTAAFNAVEIAMAATLPCFWIYKQVGDYIYKSHQSLNNPYQQWIDTYAGEEFALAVQKAITICDKTAQNSTKATRQKMTEAFITASRMEYAFWDAAYNLTKWNNGKTLSIY